MKKCEEYKLKYFPWRWGDRRDGWRLRNITPISILESYFSPKRVDAQILVQETIPIDNIEAFIKEHKEEMPDLSLMHVIIAAAVRLFSQRPKLNRFVFRNKLYARKYISMSITIRRSMTDEGEETLIKLYFLPTDTLYDVVRKVQQALDENKHEGDQNTADKFSKSLTYLPGFLIRFMVFIIRWLDKFNILPRALEEISPWHSSLYLANMGSIGSESVYHPLYEIGTCSFFLTTGKKTTQHIPRRSGEVLSLKTIMLKLSLDGRICDGLYLASTLRMIGRLYMNPEQLLSPPEQVVVDDGVGRKRID